MEVGRKRVESGDHQGVDSDGRELGGSWGGPRVGTIGTRG